MKSLVLLCVILLSSCAFARLMTKTSMSKNMNNAQNVLKNLIQGPNADITAMSDIPARFTTGYFKVNTTTDSALFYIFHPAKYSSEANITSIPIVIWLNGGPGCSSQEGNFQELGPNFIQFNPTTQKYEEAVRNVSWNDYYNLVIIDHPIGTGYSWIATPQEFVTNQTQVSKQFYYALINFYNDDRFKKYQSTPLYIFGESYAGHYIPSIAEYILQQNELTPPPALKVPLSGIGIGDGWTDPINQLSENGLFAYSAGLVDDNERRQVEFYQMEGVLRIKSGDYKGALDSFDNVIGTIQNASGGVNEYNYRVYGEYEEQEKQMNEYLNYPETRQRYGVDPRVGRFVGCNETVYLRLADDFMQSVAYKFPYILDRIRVLLYNGQDDVIVNTPSAQNWISKLVWNKQGEFNDADFKIWKLNGKVVGAGKTVDKLSFVVVNKAGHMVPMDALDSSCDLLGRFISGKTNWDQ